MQTLAHWLFESRYPVVFTGAGIRTESGLPDFRGPDGVWTRRDKGLPPKPMSKLWDAVEPNKGHLAILELQKIGKLKNNRIDPPIPSDGSILKATISLCRTKNT